MEHVDTGLMIIATASHCHTWLHGGKCCFERIAWQAYAQTVCWAGLSLVAHVIFG